MKIDGLPLWRKSNSTLAMVSVVLLSGCVSSTVITPQGIVGTAPQATATDVLTLTQADVFPKPAPRPGTEQSVQSTELALAPVEGGVPVAENAVVADTAVAAATATPPNPVVSAQKVATLEPSDVNSRIASAEKAPVAGDTIVATAPKQPIAPAPQMVAAVKADTKSGGFLNSLFGKNSSRKTPQVKVAPPKPARVIATASATGSALPGVSRERALGVNSTTATLEPIQVASAAGLARLAPNGLKTQHSGVDVKCLKPALVRVLKRVEKRYGKAVVVTSGYRSAKRNASIRGAKNSLHIYCSAADIQVAGVDKWTLAKYLRSLPGRGGVGTYCHTKSVHVDIGPKRDWNWRCRRR